MPLAAYGAGPALLAEPFTYSDGALETVAPAVWSATNYVPGNPGRLRAISGRAGHLTNGTYLDSATVPTFGPADYGLEVAEPAGNNQHLFVYMLAGAGGAYVLRYFRDDGNNRDDLRLYRATSPSTLNASLAQFYTSATTRIVAGSRLLVRVGAGGTPLELAHSYPGGPGLVQLTPLSGDATVDVASPITAAGAFVLETQSSALRIDNVAITDLEAPAVTVTGRRGSLNLLGVGR